MIDGPRRAPGRAALVCSVPVLSLPAFTNNQSLGSGPRSPWRGVCHESRPGSPHARPRLPSAPPGACRGTSWGPPPRRTGRSTAGGCGSSGVGFPTRDHQRYATTSSSSAPRAVRSRGAIHLCACVPGPRIIPGIRELQPGL